jgi:hypothetical protein
MLIYGSSVYFIKSCRVYTISICIVCFVNQYTQLGLSFLIQADAIYESITTYDKQWLFSCNPYRTNTHFIMLRYYSGYICYITRTHRNPR